MTLNANDAKAMRKGTHRKPSSATFAQNFANFAFKFNDSLRLKFVLTQAHQVLGLSIVRCADFSCQPFAVVARASVINKCVLLRLSIARFSLCCRRVAGPRPGVLHVLVEPVDSLRKHIQQSL